MKVEIKKIGIGNVIFSALPVAVFVVMLITALMELFNPDGTVGLDYLMSLVMRAIQGTLLTLVSVVFFLLAYNILCAVGIRGVRVELEDK